MNDELRELMHRAQDRDLAPALSAAERLALEDALRDPQTRADFERLRQVQARLRSLPGSPPPRSVAPAVLSDIRASAALARLPQAPAAPPGLAARLAARIAEEVAGEATPVLAPDPEHDHPQVIAALRALPPLAPPASLAPQLAARFAREARSNPAPLVLVSALVVALGLLTFSYAWPNVQAGATVLRALLAQLSPGTFVGFGLALLASVLLLWRPSPAVRRLGAAGYALALLLGVPGLLGLYGGQGDLSRVRVGGNLSVAGPVAGNVISLGGDVVLQPGARVGGEVVAFLGDVRRAPGAQVEGRVSALLGQVQDGPGQADPARPALSTRPLPALGTASAFEPLLQWVGGATWPRVYVALLGGLTLLLFLLGAAKRLVGRQRQAPLRSLAAGTLVFGLLLPPLLLGGLSGFLVPALVGSLLLLLAFSVGLSVTLYGFGRAVMRRLRLQGADLLGALVGLCAFAASLSLPPLALVLWLLGGTWGAGTLLLARPEPGQAESGPPAPAGSR